MPYSGQYTCLRVSKIRDWRLTKDIYIVAFEITNRDILIPGTAKIFFLRFFLGSFVINVEIISSVRSESGSGWRTEGTGKEIEEKKEENSRRPIFPFLGVSSSMKIGR